MNTGPLDYAAELSALCRLILERKCEETLSTHVAVFFFEEDASVIVQRAELLQRRMNADYAKAVQRDIQKANADG